MGSHERHAAFSIKQTCRVDVCFGQIHTLILPVPKPNVNMEYRFSPSAANRIIRVGRDFSDLEDGIPSLLVWWEGDYNLSRPFRIRLRKNSYGDFKVTASTGQTIDLNNLKTWDGLSRWYADHAVIFDQGMIVVQPPLFKWVRS